MEAKASNSFKKVHKRFDQRPTGSEHKKLHRLIDSDQTLKGENPSCVKLWSQRVKSIIKNANVIGNQTFYISKSKLEEAAKEAFMLVTQECMASCDKLTLVKTLEKRLKEFKKQQLFSHGAFDDNKVMSWLV